MKINEIYTSIQGETSFAGLPCTFIRFTGCNLRCSYCDTAYAYDEGAEMTIDQVVDAVKQPSSFLVLLTGGEPLLQPEAFDLAKRLLDSGRRVLVETNGSIDISRLDRRAVAIVDIKCPGSGMADRMDWNNISRLRSQDQIKFVLSDRADYDWAKQVIRRYSLKERSEVLLSPVFGRLAPQELGEWIVFDELSVRFQLQIHKYIWPPGARGV